MFGSSSLYPSIWISARLLPLRFPKDSHLQSIVESLGRTTRVKGFDNVSVETVTDAVLRATKHPWLMRDRRCLRQGILAFRYLKAAGHEPLIHFGIEPDSLKDKKVRAHCWVTVKGRAVMSDRLPGMKTIFTFPNTQDQTSNAH